jgi:hypothetical protein
MPRASVSRPIRSAPVFWAGGAGEPGLIRFHSFSDVVIGRHSPALNPGETSKKPRFPAAFVSFDGILDKCIGVAQMALFHQ